MRSLVAVLMTLPWIAFAQTTASQALVQQLHGVTLASSAQTSLTSQAAKPSLPPELARLTPEELTVYQQAYSWVAYYDAEMRKGQQWLDTDLVQRSAASKAAAIENCRKILNGDWIRQKRQQDELMRTTVEMEAMSSDLFSHIYERNEVAADENYKGRWCLITGSIDTIGKDIAGTPYVTFTSKRFGCVQCMFTDDDKKFLATLNKGQHVSIVGICKGKMMNVLLGRCVVVNYAPDGTKARISKAAIGMK